MTNENSKPNSGPLTSCCGRQSAIRVLDDLIERRIRDAARLTALKTFLAFHEIEGDAELALWDLLLRIPRS